MTFERLTLSVPAISIALSFVYIFLELAETACPKIVTIEKGGTGMVSCDSHGKSTSTAYWYIGDPATTSPILRLENGVPGGTLYGNGHYNITTSGAMIITNAAIKHEAVYFTLFYFHDDTDERNHIKVNITISPLSPCPVINFCNPCDECSLAVNDSRKLKCSLNGTRPLMPLKWIFNPQQGVNIVEHPPIFINNLSSDTWNSLVEISYVLSSCGQEVKFQCEAQDSFNLLGQAKSTVEIYTANCTGDSQKFTGPPMKIVVIVAGVGFGIISAAGFVTCLFIRLRMGDEIRRQGNSAYSYTELSGSQKITDEDEQTLLFRLKKHYKAIREKNISPWIKAIDVEDLYAACTCEITDSNGDRCSTSSDRLLTCKAIKDERLVLITGGPRQWETVVVEDIVQKWINESNNEFILMLIEGKDISFDQSIVGILEKEISISSELLSKTITNKKCVVLFHGLTNVKFDGNVTYEYNYKTGENIKRESFLNLTLSDLFKKLGESKPPQVHVWVSTENKSNIEKVLPEQFAKVYVSHVNEEQLDVFIKKVHEQHIGSLQQDPFEKKLSSNSLHVAKIIVNDNNVKYKKDKDSDSTSKDPVEEITDEYMSEQRDISSQESVGFLSIGEPAKNTDSLNPNTKVYEIINFLKQNQFFEEFKETPILFSIMVHAVLKQYCSQPANFDEVKTLTMEGIVYTAINSLKEIYKLEQKSKDFSTFDMALGRLAIHLIETRTDAVDRQSHVICSNRKDMDFAMKKGVLQYSSKPSEFQGPDGCTETALHCEGFSHRYLKYYFAACYIIRQKESYTEALARYDKCQNFPVFKFMIHLEEGHDEQYFDTFRGLQGDNDVIKCLYKWGNQHGVKKLMTHLQGKDLKVTSLDEEQQLDAFKSLCEKCSKMQINLRSLLFSGVVPFSLITPDLPVLKELAFFNLGVDEEVLVQILKRLSKKNIVLRFIAGELPKIMGKKSKEDMKNLNDVRVEIIHQPKESENVLWILNYETAKWVKKKI